MSGREQRRVIAAIAQALGQRRKPGRPVKPLTLGDLLPVPTKKPIGRPRVWTKFTQADAECFDQIVEWWTRKKRLDNPRARPVTMREVITNWLQDAYPGIAKHRLAPMINAYCVRISRARAP